MSQETGRGRTRQDRFESYVAQLCAALGHADRAAPFRAYCTGLLATTERKSVEPMAALVDPAHVRQRHQSMHHLVASAPWSDEAVLGVAHGWALPPLLAHGPITAWVLDDTGMPKKGTKSVGVARQYCGALGKKANGQVAVSLSVVNDAGSVPVGYRLYLPEDWMQDRERCQEVGVPVWPPGQEPLPPAERKGRGRAPQRLRRTPEHHPVSVLELAQSLPASTYQNVTWREGTAGKMRSRFAALRVRPAHDDTERTEPRPEEWLLIEWPRGEKDYRPRGSPARAAPPADVDCHRAH